MTRHSNSTRVLSKDDKRALLASLLREKLGKTSRRSELSHGQRALWFLHQSQPGSPAYNTAFAVRIVSPVSQAALQASLQILVDRHAVLRCGFESELGEPVCVTREDCGITLDCKDVRGVDDLELRRLVESDYRRPFDLSSPPLIRATLFSQDDDRHVLLLAFHHIICDAWSIWTLVYEFSVVYPLVLKERPFDLPPLAMQFQDYAVWHNGLLNQTEGEKLWQYWRGQLSGELPLLDLPTDHSRPPVRSPAGESFFFELEAELVDRLSDVGKTHGATLFMVLLAAFHVLLHRYCGQDDIIIASPAAGRNHPDTAAAVGYFANPLPLRARLEAEFSFREFLNQVRHTVLDALAHQDFPFSLLIERLKLRREPSRCPLAETMFVLQRPPRSGYFASSGNLSADFDEGVGRLAMAPFSIAQMEGQFDLVWEAVEGGQRAMPCVFKYDANLFEVSTIARMVGHLQCLLKSIAQDAEQRIGSIELLGDEERFQLLSAWNSTDRAYKLDRCLHHWVEDTVACSPDAVAVEMADQPEVALSYSELNARANQLARHLKREGIGPESVVAICVDRSLEMVVGLLGILKAGAAYLPLDPEYPGLRLRHMLEDSNASAVLVHESTYERIPWEMAKPIRLDRDWPLISQLDPTNVESGAGPNSLAYVIYTSGSTGQPKAACNEHKGICNRLLWMQEEFCLGASDRVLQKTPFGFDVSVWEFFWPLMAGARLVLARPGGQRDSDYLVKTILQRRITTLHFVPSMLGVFLEASGVASCAAVLKNVICSGESLSSDLQKRFFDCLNVPLHNLYGPTEAAVDVTHWRCGSGGPERSVPIGRPIANIRLYLLDRFGSPVPIGVPGELYIGGVGVGRGYLNRPELTAERFIPDTFSEVDGARLYRTGDLCRWLPSGSIEYLQRFDSQVKIRGFRIELGEIESAMAEHPQVREAVVRADKDDAGGRLSGWYVVKPGSQLFSAELKEFLKARLPEYMVPSSLTPLDDLPLNQNGKLDRGALKATPVTTLLESRELAQTAIERQLVAIWTDVLGLDGVGVNDNFFDLGGHSLLLAKLKVRLDEAFEHSPSMIQLFQFTTVRALARFIAGDSFELAAQQNNDPVASGNSIAVVGLAGRFPGASDVTQFWENLCASREGIRRFDEAELRAAGLSSEAIRDSNWVPAFGWLEGIEQFDAGFFGYTPREAELLDVQQRLLLECAYEALEDSGHDPTREQARYGVFVGVGMNRYLLNNLMANRSVLEAAGSYPIMLASDKDFAATRVSYKLGLRGPSLNVQTACSTSLVAIHLACRSLLAGECDAALAGGASVSLPQDRGYRYMPDMILSPDGHCRAFDKDARGTVAGNGVGVVVLKRLEDAISDGDMIYAVVKGSAVNNDGSGKVGYTAPSVSGQVDVIRDAHRAAGISASSISYVEAHGTGTVLGDPIELAALTEAFEGASHCAIGSVKSNIGHLDCAAGVAGFIKTVLALHHRMLPPQIHFKEANPQFGLRDTPFSIQTNLQDWADHEVVRRAGVSSFGIGGTNAHVVLEEAPKASTSGVAREWQLLPVSARDEVALEAYVDRLAGALRSRPELNLADVSFTLALGRRELPCRRFWVCRNSREASIALGENRPASFETASTRDIAFLFPGQGAQTVNMAAGLYRSEPVFRAALEGCAELLRDISSMDLIALLYPPLDFASGAERIATTAAAQPALFAVEYALAQFWISLGIRPSAMLGHSLGEYVAACIAGVFSLADALRLVAWRGEVMQSQRSGAMLAVLLPESETLARLPKGLEVAAVNGPCQCVVAGLEDDILEFAERLAQQGIQSRRLNTSHAFHSALMQPAADALKAKLCSIELHAPGIPFISNLTGTWISPKQAVDPDYWARHLRYAVRFGDGLRTLLEVEGRVLLEVGPGETLTKLAHLNPALASSHCVIASQPTNDHVCDWLRAAGSLWQTGAALNWGAMYAGQSRQRVSLPSYPWQGQRYWVDPAELAQPQVEFSRALKDWFYQPTWERMGPPTATPARGSHWLLLIDDSELVSKFTKHLGEFDVTCSQVRRGKHFQALRHGDYVIAEDQPADYGAVLRDLASRDQLPDVILHCWNLGSSEKAQQNRLSSFHSLVFLAQGLGEISDLGPCRLAVVSDRMQDVIGEGVLDPSKALLLGPITVIPQEYSNLSTCSIDVDLGTLRVNWLVSDAADSNLNSARIAHRGRHRWIQGFVRIPAQEGRLPLREDGVYLITGGRGGIGTTLAEWLARTCKAAKLVLIGRSAVSKDAQTKYFLLEKEVCRLAEIYSKSGCSTTITSTENKQKQVALEQLCALHLARYLEEHGVSLDLGRSFDRKWLIARLRVIPKFERFLDFIVSVMQAEGWLSETSGRWTVVTKPQSTLESETKSLLACYPDLKGLCNLLEHCVAHYGACMSGEMDSLEVLFPEGRLNLRGAETAYLDPEGQRAQFLAASGQMVAELARNMSGRKLRVLEIGGGSGALTQSLMRALKGVSLEYCFTDVGLAQIRAAEIHSRELGYEGIQFRTLDVSVSPRDQGFEVASFDFVVGFDVVHATPSVAKTLQNLRTLLVPDGVLCLLESVNPLRFNDMVWGLTEGWWCFEDHDLRSRSPLLRSEQWLSVLRQNGFSQVCAWPNSNLELENADFALLFAQSHVENLSIDMVGWGAEDTGPEVLNIQANVADFEQMSQAIDQVKRQFGGIHGVIYAAGCAGGGTIQAKTFDDAEREFASKVDGTSVLERLLVDDHLDFWVQCSSYVSALGGFGQVAYAAASAFQDHWAEARSMTHPDSLSLAIGWERWRGIGMAASLEQRHMELAGTPLEGGMSRDEGTEVFAHLLGSSCGPRVVVSMRDFPPLLKASRTYQLGLIATHRKRPQSPHKRSKLLSTYVEPGNDVQRQIAGIWQSELGIELIGVFDDFFNLGGDSLLAIRLAARLREELHVPIAVKNLYDAPTITALAEYIESLRWAAEDPADSVAEAEEGIL